MVTDIKGETWKELYDSDKFYISNFGRVKLITKAKTTRKIVERIITQYNINGIQICFAYLDKKRISIIVHREVAKAFIKNQNNFKYVGWKDGNKKNNHESNLIWIEKISKNIIYKTGDENSNSLLSSEEKEEIKNKRKEGCELKEIAEEYNVSVMTVIRALKK